VKPFGVMVLIAVLTALLAAGCAQGSREGQGSGASESSSSSQTRQETVPRDETTREGENTGVEPAEAPFTAAPEMSGGAEGAADGIQGVSFEQHEGYERAIILFNSGDAPASRVPAWSLSSPDGEGYARIAFPGVDATSISDGILGGAILENFYVVRAPEGGLFLDIYATGAFQYRVMELADPGRLVVDYRPASVELSFPLPAQAQKTVLFEPRAGEAVTSPLKVSGYSRNAEASNTVALVDESGNVLGQSTVLSNDWLDTWGYFETSLEIPAFEGEATLRVGGESPRDGSFEGVEVPVVYGRDQG
jgi:hypothetical protein